MMIHNKKDDYQIDLFLFKGPKDVFQVFSDFGAKYSTSSVLYIFIIINFMVGIIITLAIFAFFWEIVRTN